MSTLTTSSTDTKKFNSNLDRLLETLSNFYPEDKDLKFYREKVKTGIHANAKLPSHFFLQFTQDKIQHIIERNEQYFLEEINYTEHTTNAKALLTIQKVIHLWKTTDNSKLKKTINDYLEILLIYAVKAHRRKDLVEVVNKYRKKSISL